MSLDCSHDAINTFTDCARPWGPDCHLGFDVLSLWTFTNNTQSRCPDDPRLSQSSGGLQSLALTQKACEQITGGGWNAYDNSVWWTRLTTWKFPLLQLIAQFLRPPLAVETQLFVMAHLLGDPIDTIKNLLLKLSKCQRRAQEWKEFVRMYVVTDEQQLVMGPDTGAGSLQTHSKVQFDKERHWRSLSLVVDSYDEWGNGDEAHEILKAHLEQVSQEKQRQFLHAILETGDALAADKTTKYLPMLVALIFFLFNITVAVTRTMLAVGGTSFNLTIFISIEMHGVAFSALFFWIIPAVLTSSVIGVSQTEERIRRILHRFHKEVEHINPALTQYSRLPGLISEVNDDDEDDTDRWFNGGLYSWHASYWQSRAMHPEQYDSTADQRQLSGSEVAKDVNAPERTNLLQGEGTGQMPPRSKIGQAGSAPRWCTNTIKTLSQIIKLRFLQGGFIALICVAVPNVFGMALSGMIPPDGFNCRVQGQLAIFVCWILSHELNIFFYLGFPPKSKRLFWGVYGKDLVFTLFTILFTFMTILGCFNRCSCWLDADSNLILPQRPDIDLVLRYRLQRHYPAFIFSALAIELVVIPIGIFFKYYDALLVYVQRDDGKPNADWYQKRARNMRRWKPGSLGRVSRSVRVPTWRYATEGRQPAPENVMLRDVAGQR